MIAAKCPQCGRIDSEECVVGSLGENRCPECGCVVFLEIKGA